MADDEKPRWAIDVMTAWTQDECTDFVHERIDAHLAEPRRLIVMIHSLSVGTP
jgi:hypothetical protein